MRAKNIAPYSGAGDNQALLAPRVIVTPPGGGGANDVTPLHVALRNKWTILCFALVPAAAMYFGLQFVTPVYVAEASVRIDMPQLRVTDDNSSVLPAERPTMELLRTEMAALNSPRLAQVAVKSLGLEKLPAFQECPAVSRLQMLRNAIARLRGQPVPSVECVVAPDYAAKVLLGSVGFGTNGSSYIIQISGTAADPALAARIANGYAETYITWQRGLKESLAQEADEWLSADLAKMQAKMLADDAAVEAYRQRHHLIGLHHAGGGSASGASDTVATQRLVQQNTDLGTIDATLAEKSSVLAQVRQALRDGHLDSIAPVLDSALIQQLLSHQSELSGNLAQLRANYGSTYPAVAAAEAALARNQSQIAIEADKIIRSLTSEVDGLAARKAAIASRVEGAEQQVAIESQASVDLAELQRTAETDRRIYESLFVRLKQVDAERRMERANAAVVVEALPPDVPAYPHKRLMVVGTFLAALGVGVGAAFGREMLSRRFRNAEQVEDEIGLPVLGVFAKRRRAPQDMVVDQPLSLEAEAVHSVLTHLLGNSDPGGRPLGRVVMVTSALPGEGKSCFTVALGRSAMRAGMSAFVLDCDLRRPMVERLVSGQWHDEARPLPTDRVRDTAELIAELMRRSGVDERSGLRHLSLGDYVNNPHALLAWPELQAMLKYLRSRYDFVLLDTPPVLAVSDALRLGGLADEVVVMIDWTDTPRQAVVAAARVLQRAQIAVTGLVMTKVDLRRYARTNAGAAGYLRYYPGYHSASDTAA